MLSVVIWMISSFISTCEQVLCRKGTNNIRNLWVLTRREPQHYEAVECKISLIGIHISAWFGTDLSPGGRSFSLTFQRSLRVVFRHISPCSICKRTWNYLCTWVTSWSSLYLWQRRLMNCSNMQRDLVTENTMPQQSTSVHASEHRP